jgi:hypothetical protein
MCQLAVFGAIRRESPDLGGMRAVPRLCALYPGICLTTEEKARKNLSQGSRECAKWQFGAVRRESPSGGVRDVPRLSALHPGICLTTEGRQRKTSVRVAGSVPICAIPCESLITLAYCQGAQSVGSPHQLTSSRNAQLGI